MWGKNDQQHFRKLSCPPQKNGWHFMTLVVFGTSMLFFCCFSSIVSSQRLHFHHVGPCHGVNLVAVPDGYKSPKKKCRSFTTKCSSKLKEFLCLQKPLFFRGYRLYINVYVYIYIRIYILRIVYVDIKNMNTISC